MSDSTSRKKPKLRVLTLSEEMAAAVIRQLAQVRSAAFADQMTRSALSVSSNIAEGMGKGTNRDTLKFLFIARGSLLELQSQIRVIAAVDATGWKQVISLSSITARLLGGLIRRRVERGRRER
jgi:four helix bundle protein